MKKFLFTTLVAFLAAGCATTKTKEVEVDKLFNITETKLVGGQQVIVDRIEKVAARETVPSSCRVAEVDKLFRVTDAEGTRVTKIPVREAVCPGGVVITGGQSYSSPTPSARSPAPYPAVTGGMQQDLCNHPFFGGLQGLREMYRCP